MTKRMVQTATNLSGGGITDISPEKAMVEVATAPKLHPSRRLEARARGYGVAAGYEKPYRRSVKPKFKSGPEVYGPIPHSGYYGAGEGQTPFRVGQAGFKQELDWYRRQYGTETSGLNTNEE